MIFKKTLRGGLVLAALAGGCGDDDRVGDAGRDVGTLLDAAMDTGTRTLQMAIRAACTKLNECDPASYPDIDACAADSERHFREIYLATPACDRAFAGYLDCTFMPACTVIGDVAMHDMYIEANCSEEDNFDLSCTDR